MSWRCCKDTDSRNKINCQIIFRIFKRSKNTSSFSPAVKMAPSAAGEFAFVFLVSGCGQRPGVAKRGAEQSRAGWQWGCGGGSGAHGLVAQVSCPREAAGGVLCPQHSGEVPVCPGLVALVVPMVALPSPFLPCWDHPNGMLSSDPSAP